MANKIKEILKNSVKDERLIFDIGAMIHLYPLKVLEN